MSNINLIFFNLSKEAQIISELSEYYNQKQDFDVEFIANPAEVGQFIQTTGNGIVLFKVANKADLQIAVDFLKNQKRLIKNGLVKPACLMMVKNKKVEKVLAKYGCQELLEDNMRSKTLSFKIDFWARNLKSQVSKIEKQKELKQKAKSGNLNKNEKENEKKSEFVPVNALELQSDTWILKSKSDHKKILKRYLVRMLGPSPHIGQWFELEPQPGDSMPTWKYVLKNQDEQQFILEDGAWYFSGSKPEFDWKAQRWNFSSDAPHLYFYTSDGQVYSRFKYNNGVIEVAENSNYALTKEEMIVETCDTKFNFDADKKAKEETEKLDSDKEKEGDVAGNIDGDIDGEEARDDLLSGKNKDGSVDELGSLKGKVSKKSDEEAADDNAKKKGSYQEEDLGGSYGGKKEDPFADDDDLSPKAKKKIDIEENRPTKQKDTEGIDEGDVGGHYGGKGSTDEIDDGPMSGKLKPSQKLKAKEKDPNALEEGDVGGHYGGKGSTDEIDDGPMSGKLKPSQKLKAKEKDPNASKEEGDVGGHYGGKGSTDEINDDPLSGKLKPNKKLKNKDKDSEGVDEGDVGGHYGGKGSTDEINDDPLSGKLKPNQKLKEKDKDREGVDEGDVGGHYGGKGSTDEINDDPLSGKLKPNQKLKNKDNDHEGIDEGDVGGHYGGKGSTDEIDNDPLSGKLKPGEEKQKENKKSSFAEDDLGGHYDNDGETDELDHSPLKGKLGAQKDPFSDDDADDDGLDSTNKNRSIQRTAREPGDEKLRDNPQAAPVRAGEDAPLAGTEARDGITEAELNNPEFQEQKKKVDDDSIDELDRDALDKLKKKQAALKAAGLSDDDINIDELDRDGLDKLMQKRKQALKAAGLLDEGDDVEDLGRTNPKAIKALKEKSPLRNKKEAEDQSIDELDRDALDKLKRKQEALKKAGLSDEEDDLEDLGRPEPKAIKAIKEKSPLKARRDEDDLGVEEVAREGLDKLKKKQEALKKAGLSDEDMNVDELDRDGLDKLMQKRKKALEEAGLLEKDDDLKDLGKTKPVSIAKAEKKVEEAKKRPAEIGVNELDRDEKDSLKKPKVTQEIGAKLEEDDALTSKTKKAFVGDVKEVDDELTDSQKKPSRDTKIGKTKENADKKDTEKEIAGKTIDPSEEAPDDENLDFDELIPKKKIASLESKSGKDLYADDDIDEDALIAKKKEISLDDATIGEASIEEDLSAKKQKEMLEALEAKGGDVSDLKNAIIDNSAKDKSDGKPDPNQIIDNKAEAEELKKIFEQEIPVSTESGELNVIIESVQENITHVCRFEDFYTTEVVVVIDKGMLSQDNEYNVKINLKYAGSKIEIEQMAKVIDIEEFEGEKVLVCLEFVQEISEEKYNTFSTLYQDRQESIADFMNLARGYYIEDEG